MSFHALRIFHENPDRAMEWLMDEGVQWVRMQQDEAFKEGERVANAKAEALALERERQSDTAALDDIGMEGCPPFGGSTSLALFLFGMLQALRSS